MTRGRAAIVRVIGFLVLLGIMYPVYESEIPFLAKLVLEFVLVSLFVAVFWIGPLTRAGG